MTREMTEQEELAAKLAASKINPSFRPEVRAEIEKAEAEPHDGCGKCGCKGGCKGGCKCGCK